MKTFDNEWIFQAFENHPSFFTKRMFGGLAVYVFGRMMMVLVEPTRGDRWMWHGVLICTEHAQQPGIIEEFPELAPHDILKKWLYIDSRHENFEPTMERVAKAIARDDQRFGIRPHPRKERVGYGAAVRSRKRKANRSGLTRGQLPYSECRRRGKRRSRKTSRWPRASSRALCPSP